MQKPILFAAAIFIALAIVFITLVFVARGLADPFSQALTTSLGSAIFGAGLTFFLIQASQHAGGRR